MRWRAGVTWAILPMVVSACSSRPDIVVTDGLGKPIAGATVTGTSLSIGGQATTTDRHGHADIPWAIQTTEWIGVSKPGYESVHGVSVRDREKPIRIVLAPLPQ